MLHLTIGTIYLPRFLSSVGNAGSRTSRHPSRFRALRLNGAWNKRVGYVVCIRHIDGLSVSSIATRYELKGMDRG